MDDVDWESSREERRQYIESGVRRVRRREIGIGDGEMEGVEKHGRDEVEGLEAIVETMGKKEDDKMEE